MIRRTAASTACSVSPTNSTRLIPRARPPSSSGKKSRTSSQTISSRASDSTLQSIVSIEAGPNADQHLGVAQRGVEAGVAHVDERAVLGNGQNVQLRLGDEAQRAFGAAEDRVEIEAAPPVADMREIVAGQAAVELREALRDQLRVVALNGIDQAVDGADAVGSALYPGEFLGLQRGTTATACRRAARWSVRAHGRASCRTGRSPGRSRRC